MNTGCTDFGTFIELSDMTMHRHSAVQGRLQSPNSDRQPSSSRPAFAQYSIPRFCRFARQLPV